MSGTANRLVQPTPASSWCSPPGNPPSAGGRTLALSCGDRAEPTRRRARGRSWRRRDDPETAAASSFWLKQQASRGDVSPRFGARRRNRNTTRSVVDKFGDGRNPSALAEHRAEHVLPSVLRQFWRRAAWTTPAINGTTNGDKTSNSSATRANMSSRLSLDGVGCAIVVAPEVRPVRIKDLRCHPRRTVLIASRGIDVAEGRLSAAFRLPETNRVPERQARTSDTAAEPIRRRAGRRRFVGRAG